MSDNTAQIKALIENWADAVHRGDLDAVLADHSPDIVMFDVPPPEDGVHGIAAYRETRREGDRWVVTHEHHSFPDKT